VVTHTASGEEGAAVNEGLAFRVLAIVLALPVASCSGQVSANAGWKIGKIAVARNDVSAVFMEGAGSPPVVHSTLLELDAGTTSCKVQQLTTSGVDERIWASAGTLTITGGQAPVVLAPVVDSLTDGGLAFTYDVSTVATPISPGDSLTITATGATVPAFSVDLVVPQPVTLTSPDPAGAMSASGWTISRSRDLPFAWTGGSTGNVRFWVGQSVGATSTIIDCEAPASSGSGVIPAAALGYLTPAPAGYNGPSASFGISSRQEFTVDGWDITVAALPFDSLDSAVTIE
jgi:hypothetical protein